MSAKSEAISVFQGLGYSTIKPEQLEVITAILKRDVFVILLLYDNLYPNEAKSIIVGVTPLTAIMKDLASS